MRAILIRVAALTFLGCTTIVTRAQSVSIEMLNHYSQTSFSSPLPTPTPYSLEAHLNSGGVVNTSNWGPAFYRPGTSQAPDTGSPSGFTTNTGTRNFPGAQNQGTNFFYQANFNTAGDMAAVYATSGSYGISFTSGTPPSPNPYVSGLMFDSGVTFASSVPQVSSFTNGAAWSGSGSLKVSTSGTTTLNLNSFAEYGIATYGTLITWGLGDQSGTPLAGAKSIYATALSTTQSALTSLAINGSLLTAGQTYTLEIQYGILAGLPTSSTLGGVTFTGAAVYYNNTAITITAIPEPGATAALFGVGALLGGLFYRRQKRR